MRRYIVQRDIIKEDVRVVRERAGEAWLYAVLKINGYGLGLEPMARTMEALGVDRFAVTEAADAVSLCELGVWAEEILLLRPVLDEMMIDRLLGLSVVTFSIGSESEARLLSRRGQALGVTPRAHIKVDTGMGRYGFPAADTAQIGRLYDEFADIQFTGIYTHFANAMDDALTRAQFARFQTLLTALAADGRTVGVRHCCNSTAMFRHPEMILDAVRVGSGLLGRVLGGKAFGLHPAGWCEATVDAVKTVPRGATLGYGALFRARRETKVAVVNVGSAHGFGVSDGHGRQDFRRGLGQVLRLLNGTLRGRCGLYGRVGDVPVPVLGSVCTESVLLDVTGLPCEPGDWVRVELNPLHRQYMECVWQ